MRERGRGQFYESGTRGDAADNRGTARLGVKQLATDVVKWISPMSSSSSSTRHERPQPSHRLSHSPALICSSVLRARMADLWSRRHCVGFGPLVG